MRSSRAPSQQERAPSSRIPTKSSSSHANIKPARDAPPVSQTAKKPAARATAPLNTAQQSTKPPSSSRRASAIPAGGVPPARKPASSAPPQTVALSPPPPLSTPSLTSAPSPSNSSRSNLLRRKPSTIQQYNRGDHPAPTEGNAASVKQGDYVDNGFHESVLGIALPQTWYDHSAAIAARDSPSDALYHPIRDITPPAPNYAQSATPSTRYTDSPFSHVPTPSSASSYSPVLVVANSATSPRQGPQSPTRSRPPVAARSSGKSNGAQLGLPPVRESSTSSSNSTVKPSEPRSLQPKKTIPTKPVSASTTKTASVGASQKSSRPSINRDLSEKSTSSARPELAVQVPPELAHLNVDPPTKLRDKATPPLRPSRDGTLALTGIQPPSPVVQSDLPSVYTTYHKRTSSQEVPPIADSPSLRSRFGFSPKASSRQPSPGIDSAVKQPQTVKGFARGPTPDVRTVDPPRVARRDSPAIGSSPSKSPRFGFFSRKPKVDNTKPAEKPVRPPSKGPAAGTGHEGYGRFSMQRRGSSTSSSGGYRSPSTESNASSLRKRQSTSRKSSTASKDSSELDDFLRDRLTPVVLRGSGSTVSNPTSNSDVQLPSVQNSSHNSSLDSLPRPQLLPSVVGSSTGMSPTKRPSPSQRVPSDSSQDDGPTKSQEAASSTNKVPSTSTDNNRMQRALPSNSDNTTHRRRLQKDGKLSAQSPIKGRDSIDSQPIKAGVERKAPRKWNFFQRAQASPREKSNDKGKAPAAPADGANLGRQTPLRSTAHYAMLDPVDSIGLEEVEKIAQEAENIPDDSGSEITALSRVSSHETRRRSLLPFSPVSDYSDDRDSSAPIMPPRILVRHDSEDSSRLMFAETTVAHHAPHVVEIRRTPSPTIFDEVSEQKAMITELKPEMLQVEERARTPDAPQGSFATPENESPPRHPRLSPIGRIPKVVSRRDRERKLSDSSFSRPFVRGPPKPVVKPPGSLYNQIRDLASPVESNSQPVSSTSTNSNTFFGEHKGSVDTNFRSVSTNRTSVDAFEKGDFFSFPTRNDSEISYSSSSGNNSVLAILAAQPPQEDDIWNEYNDLLDEVLPSGKAHYSYASSLGAPFHYASALYESPEFEQGWWHAQHSPSLELSGPPRSQTVPAVLSVPQQIARLMQPSFSPLTTPAVLSEVFSDYGNYSTSTLLSAKRTSNLQADSTRSIRDSQSVIPRPLKPTARAPGRTSIPEPARSSLPRSSRSSLGAQNRTSLPQSARSSIPSARLSAASTTRHSRGSAHHRSASLPEADARNSQSSLTSSVRFHRDTQLLNIAEVDGDEQSTAASLRFGALMTSKWLSFGRVLFSPAHNEMRLASEARVLIIDGLGSDWSYYVAISYPGAMIYNLGPAPVEGVSDWPGVNEKPPPNHRHINHAGMSAAFPFPKGFFTAVVFRFPLATTEQAYQACIYECKRVLRPGGFLEVAALDLDLMNMGSRARKELRGLKTRLQQQRQDVSLKNLSDMLVGLIGRRGFEDVQRCIVGVPAAGHIPKSQDMSSVSSGASGKHKWQREDRQSQEFSFADLLDDARANQLDEGNNSDDNITKMVARVGRWWYTACYEKALLRTDHSIWNDTALLRECEKQGTSFRLLICCAQKPAQTRRRTVSV